jgi:phospholipid/cholesterol/gamma-HCH transport system substrate-binding protein
MGLKGPSRSQIALALVFALSVFGFTLYVWRSFGGSLPLAPKGYRFTVLFGPEATNLTPNAQVRISGVPVGHVVATRASGKTVAATVQIDDQFAPVPDDVRAIVRFKTLLGENFVELSPGSPGAPKLPDGATLPAKAVQRAQLVDEVLQSFDAPTRRAFKQLVRGVGDALDKRGGDLNDTIGNAAPTAEDLDQLATILDRQRPALSSLVRDSGTALGALGGRSDALRQLVRSGDRVFSATARRNDALTKTVQAFPGFLGDLRTTLTATDGAVRDAAPVLRTVRPAAPQVRPALAAAARLAPHAERLARDLRPAVADLEPALPALTAIVDAAGPMLGKLDLAGRQLVPVVQLLTEYRRETVSLMANIASTANGQAGIPAADGTPQRFVRAIPPITTEQFFGFPDRLPYNRSNPYPRPGAQDDLGKPALRAFGCSHTSNDAPLPSGGAPPPCLTAAPWTFDGDTRSYPHLQPFRP